MKLRDWFVLQKNNTLDDLQRKKIYFLFLEKSQRSLNLMKVRSYVRAGVFLVLVFLIGGWGYFSSLLHDGGDRFAFIEQGKSRNAEILDVRTKKYNAGEVYAQVIGKIIKSQGDVRIVNKNKEVGIIIDEFIRAEDYIVLSEGAQIEMLVRDNVHAKILGPAEVQLQYLGKEDGIDRYAINLISGDYFEIFSFENKRRVGKHLRQKGEESQSIDKGHNGYDSNDRIIVTSSNFNIENIGSSGAFNVVVRTENGKQTVENRGQEIVMKTIIEDEEQLVVLGPEQSISLQYGKPVDNKTYFADMKEGSLSIRYVLEGEGDDEASSGSLLLTQESIIQDGGSTRKEIDPGLTESLRRILKPSIVQYHKEQIQKYYDDTRAFRIAYTNLWNTVSDVYQVFGKQEPIFPLERDYVGQGARALQELYLDIHSSYFLDDDVLDSLWELADVLFSLDYASGEEKGDYYR